MSVTIVKHAGLLWKCYYSTDPKLGATVSHSAYESYAGKQVGIKEMYDEPELSLAQDHLEEINKANPVGDYALCPLVD